jgi:hypothetical protein
VWRGVYGVLVGKHEGKRPLGRPRHRWEDNIQIDLQEVGCGGMDWIDLAQDWDRWRSLVNMVVNLQDSIKRREIFESLRTGSLLKKDSTAWSK